MTDADVSGVDPSIDACVKAQMSSWRFPVPKDRSDQPATASYEIGLTLASS